MLRFLGTLFALYALWLPLQAQQEERYSQFMLNKLGINPAYAGTQGGITLSSLVRSQWLGLDGAPETQLLSFSVPVWNQNIGLGANIVRQTIGVSSNYSMETSYSYRLRAPRGYLHIGLQTSLRMLRTDFAQLKGTQPISQDQAVPSNIQSKLVPNFGVGLYYDSENFYIGLSTPRLLKSNIDLSDDQGPISKEVQHLYLMTGFVIPVGENASLQPNILFRYVKSAPVEADINLTLIFLDKFSVGASYRPGGSRDRGLGESISLLTSAQLSDKILFGIAYDMTLTELRNYTDGTVEGVLRFTVSGKSSGSGRSVDSPRDF
jgi:type IX secretion system PorP/SprF family membrane protein